MSLFFFKTPSIANNFDDPNPLSFDFPSSLALCEDKGDWEVDGGDEEWIPASSGGWDFGDVVGVEGGEDDEDEDDDEEEDEYRGEMGGGTGGSTGNATFGEGGLGSFSSKIHLWQHHEAVLAWYENTSKKFAFRNWMMSWSCSDDVKNGCEI